MRKNPIVTISLINYNGKKFVFKAIESAVGQNYPNLEIIITDNNSTDGTKEKIENRILEWEEKRKEIIQRWLHSSDRAAEFKCELQKGSTALRDYGTSERKIGCNITKSQVIYIKNKNNDGFGKPHNQVIRIAKGDFVLLLNSDAILIPDYIEKALKAFEDEKVGAVQGKLSRYDFYKNELCKDKNNPELNIIDTTGLMMFKNRRIVCIGQGQADEGQFEEEKEIFGADGAAPIYRKEALEDAKLPIIGKMRWFHSGISPVEPRMQDLQMRFHSPKGTMEPSERHRGFKIQNSLFEYFDEDFFMYKEDVDLAWRLRLNGWKTIYAPKAVAYHGRGSGDSMAKNYIDIIRERRKINNAAKYLSFKHQRLMQIKDDFPSLLFTKHFPQFIIKEIGAWFYMAIFERFTFKVLKDLYNDIPLFLKKRKIVMAKKRVSAKEMEKWFN